MNYQSGAVSPIENIQKGWETIKNDYWVFFGMTAVAIVIVIVASLIVGFIERIISGVISAAFGIAASNAGQVAQTSAIIIPSVISLFISFFTGIIIATIAGVLFCGLYAGFSRKANTGVAEFGDLFSAVDKIQPCLIVAVISSAIQFVLGIVMLVGGLALGIGAFSTGMLVKDGQLNPAIFGGLLIGFLVMGITYLVISIIIGVLTTFVYPLIAERNLSGVEAFMTSVKSGMSNFVGLVLLLILTGLMAVGGVLACGVGILLVLPIIYAAIFSAYQSVFGSMKGGTFQTPPPPPSW
jgi:uncharacterized membrane protein